LLCSCGARGASPLGPWSFEAVEGQCAVAGREGAGSAAEECASSPRRARRTLRPRRWKAKRSGSEVPIAPQWSKVRHPVDVRSFEAGDVGGEVTGRDLVSTCLVHGLAGCAEGRPGCCPVDTQVAPVSERRAERGGRRRDCLRSSRRAVARACCPPETAGRMRTGAWQRRMGPTPNGGPCVEVAEKSAAKWRGARGVRMPIKR
jgi:hypothetical protein